MARRIQLREFDAPEAAPEPPRFSEQELETARLTAYDEGYQRGLDDAMRAAEQDQLRLREDIAQALQEMSFTYHEARGHVLRALQPLFSEMLAKLLPEAARAALPGIISEVLMPAAAAAAGIPVQIAVAQDDLAAVTAAIEDPGFPVHFFADPALLPGQAALRLGDTETAIDLDDAVEHIRAAVTGFYALQSEARIHG
ncbi:flagellar biosynthesis protein [Plastorhodobacter daqingensis]|uniref:Flagellar biosynthesis protein n=1 Tax=Plastorhodobacter daqingensis TaxID=1387281 RepID=A0ABW2UGN2_9RHOB